MLADREVFVPMRCGNLMYFWHCSTWNIGMGGGAGALFHVEHSQLVAAMGYAENAGGGFGEGDGVVEVEIGVKYC